MPTDSASSPMSSNDAHSATISPNVSPPITRISAAAWGFIVASSVVVLLTMGMRQSLGLFVEPIILTTGMSIAMVSLAMAIGQVMWGLVQPIGGLLAEKWGVRAVALLGLLLLGGGLLLMPLLQNAFGVFLIFGLLSAAGAGLASVALFIGAAAQMVPTQRTSLVSSIINASSSLGQFIFAPLVGALLQWWSWATAALAMGVLSLASLPLLYWIKARSSHSEQVDVSCCGVAVPVERVGFKTAWSSRNYRLLHLGFFTCGFHIAFLVTHLPGAVSMCGLPSTVASTALAVIGVANVIGTLAVGQLCQRFPMQKVLGSLYLMRAVAVLLYLIAPKTELNWYLFAAILGTTWLATVPPTAGLVGGMFGLRNISTLYGLTVFSHQIGAFFGAYLGGLAVQYTSSYDWMWGADMLLAILAAVASFKIKVNATS